LKTSAELPGGQYVDHEKPMPRTDVPTRKYKMGPVRL